MSAIETNRVYAPHEAGYWAAQRHGFALIDQIEAALATYYYSAIEDLLSDPWFWAPQDPSFVCESERIYGGPDHGGLAHFWEGDQRLETARRVADEAARGNAMEIIKAQRRDDEIARFILAAAQRPG